MLAASTASALPSLMPSARSCRPPTPPEAITGMPMASETPRVRPRSKPDLVPSRSMLVSRISPAPSCSIFRAHSMASMPVALRPPWVNTSHLPGAICLASIATTMHCEPCFCEASNTSCGFDTADKVSMNSSAVSNPQLVFDASQKHGSQCIVVAIDAKQVAPGKWEVFTHGGSKATGLDAIEWERKMEQLGAGEILLTSMDRDGTKSGFDLGLTRGVSDAISIPVIASGGVGGLQDLADGIKLGKADAVLAASIFHYGQHTVQEAKRYMAQQGIPMRLA